MPSKSNKYKDILLIILDLTIIYNKNKAWDFSQSGNILRYNSKDNL